MNERSLDVLISGSPPIVSSLCQGSENLLVALTLVVKLTGNFGDTLSVTCGQDTVRAAHEAGQFPNLDIKADRLRAAEPGAKAHRTTQNLLLARPLRSSPLHCSGQRNEDC